MIALTEIDRLIRALERFSTAFDAAYPGMAADDISNRLDDASETIRNAGTALAYARGWAVYRRRHRADPMEA